MPTTNSLIKKILVSRTKVYLGESFLVTVKTPKVRADSTYTTKPIMVQINGAIGAQQYLQFADYAGARKISVTAFTEDRETEHREVDIEVLEAPPCLKFPIIDIVKDIAQPYGVQCSIKNIDQLKLSNTFLEWGIQGDKVYSEGASETKISLEKHLSPDELYQTFDVRLIIHQSDETTLTAARSFTLWNDYVFTKKTKNYIQPLVNYDFVAYKTNGNALNRRGVKQLAASFTVKNIENESLFLTQRSIEFLYEDPELASVPKPFEQIDTISIEPKSERVIDCGILLSVLPKGAWGYAFHFQGKTESGCLVQTSAYFEYIANIMQLQKVVNPKLIKALHDLRANTCKNNRHTFTMKEVEEHLTRQNLSIERAMPFNSTMEGGRAINQKKNAVRGSQVSLLESLDFQAFMYETKNEGDECLPDQEPPSEDMVCQLTDEWAWVYVPARIMNARKGDTLLSPSGKTGPVSLVLHSVNPPQHYAHCGIMIQNFYTLRHSTGCDDWLQDEEYFAGTSILGDKGTDGLDPDRLKYFWPGPITQTADQAVNGSWHPDPDGHKNGDNVKFWRISAFDFYPKDNGNNLIVEPLVVKPAPIIEANLPFVRQALHKVAEEAKKISGHYRFYCYSNAAVSLDPAFNAPIRKDWWASDSRPSMCSNFIWMAVQAVQEPLIRLEGLDRITLPSELESSDTAPETMAQVDAKTLDGLYYYDAAERLKAGKALYQMYYDLVKEKAFTLIGNDAADDVASQVCNTFASDWSGENADGDHAKDSDDWENTGEGRSVSPANILLWDAPRMEGNQLVGIYGHSERLIYRPARLEWRQVSKWKKVSQNGQLTGLVLRRGMLQAGAFVAIGGQEVLTNSQGRFSVTVKAGPYSVEGRILADNMMWEGNSPVQVKAGTTTDVVINLKEPSDWFREVSIFGTMNIKDEENVGKDEFVTFTNPFRLYRVGAFYTHEEAGWTEKMGGEIRIELNMRIDWQMHDSSVNVSCHLKLFEGASENTNDLDGQKTEVFNIPKDVIDKTCTMFVRNDDENDDDHVELILKISNRRQP